MQKGTLLAKSVLVVADAHHNYIRIVAQASEIFLCGNTKWQHYELNGCWARTDKGKSVVWENWIGVWSTVPC